MSGILRFGRWRQRKLLRKFEAFLDHMRLSKSRHGMLVSYKLTALCRKSLGVYTAPNATSF